MKRPIEQTFIGPPPHARTEVNPSINEHRGNKFASGLPDIETSLGRNSYLRNPRRFENSNHVDLTDAEPEMLQLADEALWSRIDKTDGTVEFERLHGKRSGMFQKRSAYAPTYSRTTAIKGAENFRDPTNSPENLRTVDKSFFHHHAPGPAHSNLPENSITGRSQMTLTNNGISLPPSSARLQQQPPNGKLQMPVSSYQQSQRSDSSIPSPYHTMTSEQVVRKYGDDRQRIRRTNSDQLVLHDRYVRSNIKQPESHDRRMQSRSTLFLSQPEQGLEKMQRWVEDPSLEVHGNRDHTSSQYPQADNVPIQVHPEGVQPRLSSLRDVEVRKVATMPTLDLYHQHPSSYRDAPRELAHPSKMTSIRPTYSYAGG